MEYSFLSYMQHFAKKRFSILAVTKHTHKHTPTLTHPISLGSTLTRLARLVAYNEGTKDSHARLKCEYFTIDVVYHQIALMQTLLRLRGMREWQKNVCVCVCQETCRLRQNDIMMNFCWFSCRPLDTQTHPHVLALRANTRQEIFLLLLCSSPLNLCLCAPSMMRRNAIRCQVWRTFWRETMRQYAPDRRVNRLWRLIGSIFGRWWNSRGAFIARSVAICIFLGENTFELRASLFHSCRRKTFKWMIVRRRCWPVITFVLIQICLRVEQSFWRGSWLHPYSHIPHS